MTTILLKTKFKCKFCDKIYNRKSSYDKHISKCEFINSELVKRETKQDEGIDISNFKIYEVIKELMQKQAKQEKEIESLKQFINKIKKRQNIIEWLNENCKKNISFQTFVNSIILERKHLDYIFRYDFVEGLMFIFQEIFPLNQDIPLKCFDQKPGTFFIIRDEEWVAMTLLEFENFINSMSRYIIKEFGNWQKENYEKIFNDDNFKDIYQQNLVKVLGTNISKDKLNLRIKNKLFSYLKLNLKRINQFEFD